MMRSAELRDCLQSPHLWYDEGASVLTSTDLQKSEQQLGTAREQKDSMEQLNAAYKSMYLASLALLHSIRYRVSGFRCLVSVLQEYFVKKGLLDSAQVEKLMSAQRMEGKPDENIHAAESFLAAAKEILKTQQQGGKR